MTEPDHHLSPQGRARREAMLGELTEAMARLRRRRRARRMGIGAATALLLCVLAFRAAHDPTIGARTVSVPPPMDPRTPSSAVLVQTQVGIVARLRAAPPPLVVRIDDAQLLHTLVDIGRPAGLIRLGDHVALSAPVTDEEIAGP